MAAETVKGKIGLPLAKGFALCALLMLGIWLSSQLTDGPTKFDREIWLSGWRDDVSVEPPRLRMADSLVEQGILLGMSQNQINAMLGPQTDTHHFRPTHDYVYWLGPERSYFSIDSEWLVLTFDSDGKVSQARIVRD